MAKKVLVLGASGMLGSMVADVLSRDKTIMLTASARNPESAFRLKKILKGIEGIYFNVKDIPSGRCGVDFFTQYDYIVNCIGITKPYCNDNNPDEIVNAIEINALFSNLLAEMLTGTNSKMLQIATDCVYSGKTGLSSEKTLHDATDVYGKTKSLGESKFPNIFNLRCSIIGPEWNRSTFLLEWLIRQEKSASLNGYTNHEWNGVTTLSFARLCLGIIKNDTELPNLQHIIPGDIVSKYDLLLHMAEAYGRNDLQINKFEAASVIDRTLSTSNTVMNKMLWEQAGYKEIPGIADMVKEMAAFDYRFREAE